MPTILVEVMPKAELLDPQGKAIAAALARRGNGSFSTVRVGKRFELTIDAPEDEALRLAGEIAHDMLSNSVIEDVVGVSVLEAVPAGASA